MKIVIIYPQLFFVYIIVYLVAERKTLEEEEEKEEEDRVFIKMEKQESGWRACKHTTLNMWV